MSKLSQHNNGESIFLIKNKIDFYTYLITFVMASTAFGGALISLTLSCIRKTTLTYPTFSFGDGTGSEYDAPIIIKVFFQY